LCARANFSGLDRRGDVCDNVVVFVFAGFRPPRVLSVLLIFCSGHVLPGWINAGPAAGALKTKVKRLSLWLRSPGVCALVMVGCISCDQMPGAMGTGIEGTITISPSHPGADAG